MVKLFPGPFFSDRVLNHAREVRDIGIFVQFSMCAGVARFAHPLPQSLVLEQLAKPGAERPMISYRYQKAVLAIVHQHGYPAYIGTDYRDGGRHRFEERSPKPFAAAWLHEYCRFPDNLQRLHIRPGLEYLDLR